MKDKVRRVELPHHVMYATDKASSKITHKCKFEDVVLANPAGITHTVEKLMAKNQSNS